MLNRYGQGSMKYKMIKVEISQTNITRYKTCALLHTRLAP